MRVHAMMTILLGALAAAPAGAQEKQPLPEKQQMKERVPMRITINGEDVTDRMQPFMQRRARLGISVGLSSRSSDSIGAYVQAVTPGGPAAKAGLRSGDLITRLDGKSLTERDGQKVREEDSAPGVRLIEIAAKLEPHDTIAVDFVREGKRQTVKLVTGDEPMTAMGPESNQFYFRMPSGEEREFRFPGMQVEPMPGMEGQNRIEIMRRPGWTAAPMAFGTGMLGDLELAPLNPDLGSYFGATEGVLVIRVPATSPLGLKGGDVVLTVDGRKPSSPSSLIRILRSYDEGESFKLEVLRQRKHETITARLGEKPNRDDDD